MTGRTDNPASGIRGRALDKPQKVAFRDHYQICPTCGHFLGVSQAEFSDLSVTLQVEHYRQSAAVIRRRATHTKGALRQYYLTIARQRDRFADFAEDQLSSRRSPTLRHIFTYIIKRGVARVAVRSYGAIFNKRFGLYPRALEFRDRLRQWRFALRHITLP
jgi:hypothetical protein